MKMLICWLGGLFLAASSLDAQIAFWNLDSLLLSAGVTNSNSMFNVSADIGSGTASSLHASTTTFSTPSGNGSAQSISATKWSVGDYWQFQSSTLGFSNIQISWDQASSSTGPGFGRLQYSTDGSLFTTFGSDYAILENGTPFTTWGSVPPRSAHYTFNYNLSSITALNNQATVYFRLLDPSTTSAGGGTVGTTGADRVDNFSIVQVPEPATTILGGLGLLALAFLRCRNPAQTRPGM